MAETIEIIPEKHKRLELFITSLKKQQRKFNNPMDAHAHIKQSLLEIEKKHASIFDGYMTIFSLQDFKYMSEYKFYMFKTFCHVILIHDNGAYGIYTINRAIYLRDSYIFYKEETNRLFETVNDSGKSLWEHAPK
jgi:hypothetical protein